MVEPILLDLIYIEVELVDGGLYDFIIFYCLQRKFVFPYNGYIVVVEEDDTFGVFDNGGGIRSDKISVERLIFLAVPMAAPA